jgi:15-cis-phytoene synthase
MSQELLSFLRQWDRPRYLSLLLMPQDVQPDVLALYCFNAELERIPVVVSEPQIGEIRLQWWVDTLDAMGQGTPQDHPVAAALANTIGKHRLPIATLSKMADAQSRLLYADRPESIEELEAYCGQTTSALIQLTAIILSLNDAPRGAEAAGLAGVAQGIAQILSDEKRFASLIPKNWDTAKLAARGLKRLSEARAKTVPSSIFPAWLPATLAEKQLRSPGRQLGALAKQWTLWRAARQQKL